MEAERPPPVNAGPAPIAEALSRLPGPLRPPFLPSSMQLLHGIHLAYCTNIHRGESWAETMAALERHTLSVRQRVAPRQPYAIGLRLGAAAARDLLDRETRLAFQRWLDRHDCYVFTINGFPYGKFHGSRVKEQVFQPDWSTALRTEYTESLFRILSDLLPHGLSGSVSTVPGSHKSLVPDEPYADLIRQNLRSHAAWLARFADRTGQDLHLGLEPEPLGWIENSPESIDLFHQLGRSEDIQRCLGINYDTCHFAVEYENPASALKALGDAGIRISKLHLSSALRLAPTTAALRLMESFRDEVYFHQVIARREDGVLERHADLPEALASDPQRRGIEEWRVHFHVPLHAPPQEHLETTADHLTGTLDVLADHPGLCQHLEMETYTWEVLPPDIRAASVEDQLEREYAWTLAELRRRSLAPPSPA